MTHSAATGLHLFPLDGRRQLAGHEERRRPGQLQLTGIAAGERRLMFAVLEDALLVVTRGSAFAPGRRGRLVRETLAWILSDDRQWPFSFLNVCEALDVDVGRMRVGLAPVLPPTAA